MFPKLARYIEMSDKPDLLPPGMLGALAACFTWDELCDALVHLIGSSDRIRGPVQRRIYLLAQGSPDSAALGRLVPRLVAVAAEHIRLQRRIGAILSSLFKFLPPETQRDVIAYWTASPSVDSLDRWLKVVGQFAQYFDPDEIYQCWVRTGDYVAVQLIADKAPPPFVQKVLGRLIEHCDDGRVVSRAALRAPELSESHLDSIKAKFPVSYVYLCAQTGRALPEAFAIDTFTKEDPDITLGNRPLILWAVGHLGMWDTLERICELWPSIREQEAEYWSGVESQARHYS